MKHFLVVFAFFFAALTGLQPLAQAASSPCNGPNGSLFNLEPRPNAAVQVARSIAVLPNPAGNNDLVVAVGADARGLEGGSAPIISEDAFYVERSGSDCTPDLEGGLPSILTPENQLFIPIEGVPSVIIANSARSDMDFPDLALASGVVHPGGRKVIDNVQKHFGMTDVQFRFSRTVLRNYGNMSSPTVMFVLEEVVRSGDPRPGDWGVMTALGPGMAAEVALLRC